VGGYENEMCPVTPVSPLVGKTYRGNLLVKWWRRQHHSYFKKNITGTPESSTPPMSMYQQCATIATGDTGPTVLPNAKTLQRNKMRHATRWFTNLMVRRYYFSSRWLLVCYHTTNVDIELF
jgi:hypothetical protein